ncbi:MAG TPA: SRPBCC family protein [Thermoanaerobaculia bacterium]|nr:SRPBCC family protein [Thermoanaerobaculia bacterium]
MIVNFHARTLRAPADRIAALVATLASPEDALWPRDRWPRMKLDGPLSVGSRGGHGPIRYAIQIYEPERRIRFRFLGPEGFDGYHEFRFETAGEGLTRIEHDLRMKPRGRSRLTWPLVYRPLHDALIEDAFDRAERFCGTAPRRRRWSPWVRVLRFGMRRRSSR